MITYDFTNGEGCEEEATLDLEILPLPVVFIDPISPLCENDGVFELNFGPLGGDWFGDVDDDGEIDPEDLGTGSFTGFYEFTDSDGCSDEVTIDFDILESPTVQIDPIADICQGNGVVQLTANPPNGMWSGAADPTGLVLSLIHI